MGLGAVLAGHPGRKMHPVYACAQCSHSARRRGRPPVMPAIALTADQLLFASLTRRSLDQGCLVHIGSLTFGEPRFDRLRGPSEWGQPGPSSGMVWKGQREYDGCRWRLAGLPPVSQLA